MKIAIIGAGLSGIATCWYFINKNPHCQVTVFDHQSIGSGTSGTAANLLHYFAGIHAKKNRFGVEGYDQTIDLLNCASKYSKCQLFRETTLVRIPTNDQQEQDFKKCAINHVETEWIDKETSYNYLPDRIQRALLIIKNALIVDTKSYLFALWKACQLKGAQFANMHIENLAELSGFDKVVIASGERVVQFAELSHLPIRPIKGQLLKIKWPKSIPFPKYPLSRGCSIIPLADHRTCLLGATFEKKFSSIQPDLEYAKKELLEKAAKLFPELANAEVIECLSGVRSSTPNHLPLIGEIHPRIYVITGLGSKGLLYHALYAKKLCDLIDSS